MHLMMLVSVIIGCKEKISEKHVPYDGPELAAQFEFDRTKDPALGYVPSERHLYALNQARESKLYNPESFTTYGSWVERGPNTDFVGSSNGNTRANSGKTSGRSKSMLVDGADVTGNTVFVAGVDGGLWKTTDITASPATWTLVNDYLSNLAITGICQDPTNNNTMYFCTGESYNNSDAVRGVGVFKSTDHGVTWSQLAATSTYYYCSRILCDATGNIYLGTNGNGLLRSINGGTSWTSITPSGTNTAVADLDLSSTGRLHVTLGVIYSGACYYRFTDIPATVASAGWTSATSGAPSSTIRIEMACSGSTLYAIGSNGSYKITSVYKSTDGGANWTNTALTGTNQTDINGTGSTGQAWYCLGMDIDPSNSNNVIIGELNCLKSTDGGATFSKLSEWVGNTGQYVHADIQSMKWYNSGNTLLITSDGGIFYSADKGVTIRDRNVGLRIKQFYSCAIHPSTTNYFLAGAQDNGSHKFTSAGLSGTEEYLGGDGCFQHIDQDEPTYQFGSYVYNIFWYSSNSGTNWGGTYFYKGTSLAPSYFGSFVNASDYDNTNNIMYAGSDAGEFFRCTRAAMVTGGAYYYTDGFPAGAEIVTITGFNSSKVSAICTSPYTAHKVFFGTAGGRLIRVDGANSIASGSAGTVISSGFPVANLSCVNLGTDDNNIAVAFSSYGVNHVLVTGNGGTIWTNITGNLPDMPVRWCMFVPGDNTKMFLATETGVWLTQLINGASTVWIASSTFPTVRTDMIKYRSSDALLAAATHGRGLWTQSLSSALPVNDFTLRGKWVNSNSVELNWNNTSSNIKVFEPEVSYNGGEFKKAGTINAGGGSTYTFKHAPETHNVLYRVKSININGEQKYSNTLSLRSNQIGNGLEIIQVYPNPVQNQLKIAFNIAGKSNITYTITSLSGQVLFNEKEYLDYTGSYIRTKQVASLPKGTYVFTIKSDTDKKSVKFMKL